MAKTKKHQGLTECGLSQSEFKKFHDKKTNEGYEIINISSLKHLGTIKLSGIWMLSNVVSTSITYDASFEDFIELAKGKLEQGLVPHDVCGYYLNNHIKYTVIWKNSTDHSIFMELNDDYDEFQAKFNNYIEKGYSLKKLKSYFVNGKVYYCSIWSEIMSNDFIARHGMAAKEFQALFDKYTNRGYVLQDISACYNIKQSNLNYTALWYYSMKPIFFITKYDLSQSEYKNFVKEYIDANYYPTSLSSYEHNGREYYACSVRL